MTDAADPRAHAFTQARRTALAVPGYPGAKPATEAEAYAIQDCARGLWADEVAGWKVGLIQPPHDAALGRTRLFGPIFSRNVQAVTDKGAPFAIIPGGFGAVEAEYLLRLGADVPPATGWTAESAAGVVDAAFVGVELAGSPFAEINDHGPLVTISDFGNNAGLIVGAEMTGGLSALGASSCVMRIDGLEIASGSPASIPGGPIGSVVELLNHMGRRGETLKRGTLVSTGAATGVHQVRAGQSAVADFGAHGAIAVAMVAAC